MLASVLLSYVLLALAGSPSAPASPPAAAAKPAAAKIPATPPKSGAAPAKGAAKAGSPTPAAATHAASSAVDKLVARMQERYDSAADYRARFTQQYPYAATGRERTS